MARHELWVELEDRPGNLAAVAADLAACGANIVQLDVHAGGAGTVVDRLVVQVPDDRSADLAAALGRLAGQLAVPAPARVPRRPPTTLERLVVLADGGLVRLRHLAPGDREALVAHRRRCSLPDAGPGDVALAALVGTDIVGAARYDLDPGGVDADLAVVVEDRHRRRGIGTLLVAELAALAAHAEVRRLRAVSRPDDDALARTLRRAGLPLRCRAGSGATVLESGLA
jgi:GNAT superfamily N-acetyltransferase